MLKKWLHKLGFEYKVIRKGIFIGRYKYLNMVEDCQKFLRIMKDLKSYLIEFGKNKSMKTKNYSVYYAVINYIY